MPPRTCVFFDKPGGCRRGNQCKFLHTNSSSPRPSSRPSSPAPSQGNSPSSQTSRPTAPPGVCSYYWTTGTCRREFACRFQHTSASPVQNAASQPIIRSTQSSAIDSIAPFLTEAGLARVTGTSTDIFFSTDSSKDLSPTEAHNALKRYLLDHYRFRMTFDIYAFLKPLSSAHSGNASWSTEEGQLLLSTCSATPNGLLRLTDILKWSPVSIKAGSHRETLSFQRGYLPLLRYLSSEFVVKSTLCHLVNALYMLIMENLDHFADVVEECMQAIMVAKSFKDPQFPASKEPLGSQVLASLTSVFFECLTRFKNAVAIYPRLAPLVKHLDNWATTWIEGVSSTPPGFDDPFKNAAPAARDHIITHLRSKIDRLVSIVDREQTKLDRSLQGGRQVTSFVTNTGSNEGIIAALQTTYDGPGEDRRDGPRHDNDHRDIEKIRIAPTHEELISRIPPFLPANLYDAPHPLPADSMERLLDIQFRLLREELTAPLRTSVQLIRDDLMVSPRTKTRLSELILKGGGKYRGYADGQESIMVNAYTNVKFTPFVANFRGISVGITFDSPPGRARAPESRARAAFWEGMSGKRLMQGGLVALVWKTQAEVAVHLGTLTSSTRDICDSAKRDRDRVTARVAFFDPQVELRILQTFKHAEHDLGIKVLVEAPVMFEAIRPFLEALRVEPETIPFREYLVHHPPGFFDSFRIQPPAYALVPNFNYKLSSLFPPEAGIQDLRMSVTDPTSIDHARQELRRASRLDHSQVDAIVETLLRQVSLIQGPPGTGKSYTGVELLRVLLDNKVGPVLMIAFTNHALDHMLSSVLDTGMTKKMVRLGSRSADERIAKFSIENMEMVQGKSRLDYTFGYHHRELKDVEEEVKKLMTDFLKVAIASDRITGYLELHHPEHHEHIINPPMWISTIKAINSEDSDGPWKRVGRNGQGDDLDISMYGYWTSCEDLHFVDALAHPRSPSPNHHVSSSGQNMFGTLMDLETVSQHNSDSEDVQSDSDDEDAVEERWQKVSVAQEPEAPIEAPQVPSRGATPSSSNSCAPSGFIRPSDLRDPASFFFAHGCDTVPVVPTSDRALEELLDFGDIWMMSQSERSRLHGYWVEVVRTDLRQNQLEDFERLRRKHSDKLRKFNEGKDEARRQLLQNVDIIGCTTTGAAKLTSLLKGVAPRIMMAEEAGQILEVQVLGSLVPSIEHLILIGDPLQLRPTLNNYSLSMDSRRGSELFKFDMSLMERLAGSGLPMSRIDVQRRMRPEISSLIRNTLYPGLQDHDLVKHHPHVRGFAKDVFFFSHNHKENGGVEESASKYNTFEVDMIKDLVLYLLRQGCYSEEGDIVVLCAYLGQLARVRDALANEVAVVIDDRDQVALADQEAETEEASDPTIGVERVRVSQRVRLRTVDNYQGEEAKIIILSLVRNSGASDDVELTGIISSGRANIGFLKSKNRTNVALSRAREGLFILGNALNLTSRSDMWRSVIDELEQNEAIGHAFPIVCQRHPDTVEYISEPGKLRRLAPDGGCLMHCDTRLKCGHLCPYKCHSDDPSHIAVSCLQPCRRLCPRGHPCDRQCADPCGECQFPVSDVELPCGHTKTAVPCYLMDSLSEVFCDEVVIKTLPNCEHTPKLKCSEDTAHFRCEAPCGGIMTSCCGRDCLSRCFECQAANAPAVDGPIPRQMHRQHPCKKVLFCEHPCSNPCSQDHRCTSTCQEACRQVCSHARCKKPCSAPCSPCQAPCTWNCSHYTCPVPCGSVCARLPCDKRCEKLLRCDHRCPSVCGEDCSIQICPICAPQGIRESVVDVIMYRSLEDIDPEQETLDDLLITLPNCHHIFTVETLDGICDMQKYYRRDGPDGRWLGFQNPPTDFQKPPTCPTCRKAITSPRYGRIFKRADLDILENNVASQMSRSLAQVHGMVDSLSTTNIRAMVTTEAARIKVPRGSPSSGTAKSRTKARAAILREKRYLPIQFNALDPGSEKYHFVVPAVVQAWKRATKDLLATYREARRVAETRSAHVHAWEAAFSSLYDQEVASALNVPSRAPRKPREHAMRVAKIKVGQPPPLADKRFLVETFWVTLDLRFTLASLAQTWLGAVTSCSPEQRRAWAVYIGFILKTCSQDASIASEITHQSDSHRQKTKTAVYRMRAELEQFRFNIQMSRENNTLTVKYRNELADTAAQKATNAKQSTLSTVNDYLRVRGSKQQEEQWLEDNFTNIARTIMEEWSAIEMSLRDCTFYQPVSLEEQMSVVKALNSSLDFSHAGHFYRCPNGHLYVIGDCGGATQIASCSECGETIGGTGHALVSTNTRATDFDQLHLQQGARPSPFPWGR